jgi:hypothetical protein
MAMVDIARELSVAIEAASRTARGERALKGHDEYYEFLVAGRAPVHFEIAGGKLKFGDGPAPRREPLRYTRLELSEATLRAILKGDLSPVGAMERGELLLRTRLYGGGQMLMLLRAAYDLARARRLESGILISTRAASC